MSIVQRSIRTVWGLGLAVGISAWGGARACPADELNHGVTHWNTVSLSAITAGGQNPLVQTRSLAMVHIAIHDALNGVERRYAPYAFDGRAAAGASPRAAVAAAARDVLVKTIPSFGTPERQAAGVAAVDAAYAAALAGIPEGAAKSDGIAAGQAAAAAILARRQTDGATAVVPYTPGSAPGAWQPTPNPVPPDPAPGGAGLVPAFLPGWGHLPPFALETGAQFRPAGPPALTSEEYAREYDEVKSLGVKGSTARSEDQSAIARFWYENSSDGWNRIARVVAAPANLDAWETARLFALLNAAMADGYIAGFDGKYAYNFWRPVTAIRAGDTDGNPNTAADPNWESFLNTPPSPDYPSTHSVLGAAAAEVLARFFGNDQIAFTMTSGAPFPSITRSFTSFSQAAQENADSRVYAGIHFRSACREGVTLGTRIGAWTFEGLMK